MGGYNSHLRRSSPCGTKVHLASMDAASVRKRASLAVMLIAGWTLVALFSAVRIALDTTYAGQELDWSGALFRGAAHAYPWALTTPAVLWPR